MRTRIKSISFGDKIFARVTRNGQTILNFVSEKVANMAQLMNELRFAIKGVEGLVMIHIRNYNQGWGEERPLMLYAPRIRHSNHSMRYTESTKSGKASGMMFSPWETH